MSLIERLRSLGRGSGPYQSPSALCAEAATQLEAMQAEIDRLRRALLGVEGRFNYARSMYHDATRWSGEDDPDGEGNLLDYVFAEVRASLDRQGK